MPSHPDAHSADDLKAATYKALFRLENGQGRV